MRGGCRARAGTASTTLDSSAARPRIVSAVGDDPDLEHLDPVDGGWWGDGKRCERCGIAFCHAHRPGRFRRRVWVGPTPSAYHTSPWCGSAPPGVKARAAGARAVRLDLEGGDLEGIVTERPGVPAGWKQVGEAEAIARGLPACLRC